MVLLPIHILKKESREDGDETVRLSEPTTGFFRVQIPTSISSSFNMNIYDVAGRLVFAKKYQKLFGVMDIPVDLSRMPAATSQLVCEDEESKYTTRILKR
jgi:hypothetical protein